MRAQLLVAKHAVCCVKTVARAAVPHQAHNQREAWKWWALCAAGGGGDSGGGSGGSRHSQHLQAHHLLALHPHAFPSVSLPHSLPRIPFRFPFPPFQAAPVHDGGLRRRALRAKGGTMAWGTASLLV